MAALSGLIARPSDRVWYPSLPLKLNMKLRVQRSVVNGAALDVRILTTAVPVLPIPGDAALKMVYQSLVEVDAGSTIWRAFPPAAFASVTTDVVQ
jgi:hypothetical protein